MWARKVKFRTFLWKIPCQACLCGSAPSVASRPGAAVIIAFLWLVLVVMFAVSEWDGSSPLDLRAEWGAHLAFLSVGGGDPHAGQGGAGRLGSLGRACVGQ